MSEQIKGKLQSADFYPLGVETEADYITATFRVPRDTTFYPGEYTITFPSPKQPCTRCDGEGVIYTAADGMEKEYGDKLDCPECGGTATSPERTKETDENG